MTEARSAVSGRQLIVAVVAFAVLVGGYFAVRQIMLPPTQPELAEGQAVVEAFLAKVREGQPGEAWDASSTEFKSIEGRESFMRKAKATEVLQDELRFGSTQDVKVQDRPRTEFLYTSLKSGKTVRILVGFDRGEWKVDRLTF